MLPGLELDEALGPDLVQDAEAALPAPDGVGGLDDVAGAAVAASVLDTAEGGDGDGGGTGPGRGGGGGGCWFGHIFIYLFCVVYALYLRVCLSSLVWWTPQVKDTIRAGLCRVRRSWLSVHELIT